MIHYALKCSEGHRFDSWFKSAASYDKLRAADLVNCAICGTTQVQKDLMAPRVAAATKAEPAPETPPAPTDLRRPAHPAEQALAALRKHIEANSDYVGRDFAQEARAMHSGEAPERPIHGEARAEDARKLVEDGIPVVPLPFAPGRKTN